MRMVVLKVATLCWILPVQCALANKHPFGLGVVLGDPTGLTAKYVLNRKQAVDAALSFGRHRLYIHGSWLSLWPTHAEIDKFPLTWYLGIGPRLLRHEHSKHHHPHASSDDLHLGARAPLGLRMNFRKPRIEVFGEISLTLDVVPETDVDFDFGVGARYYF